MALEKRKAEQEKIPKEERLKQIQQMRERLNQHVSNRSRDAKTMNISHKTKQLMQEKASQLKVQSKEQEKGRDAPAR